MYSGFQILKWMTYNLSCYQLICYAPLPSYYKTILLKYNSFVPRIFPRDLEKFISNYADCCERYHQHFQDKMTAQSFVKGEILTKFYVTGYGREIF